MKGTGIIAGVSVAHDRASVDQIEAVDVATPADAVSIRERQDVSEAFVLVTCNRAEAYAVAADREAAWNALTPLVANVPDEVVLELGHEESLEHLLRVAAGLESMIVGEDQILGQLRDAYHDARAGDALGPMLEAALTTALHVGERARSETAINEGALSIGSAAVELAGEEVDLAEASGLVVGAGEMGSLAAAALASATDQVHVANRTRAAAEQVATDVGATPATLEDIPAILPDVDVVVTATASCEPIIERADLAHAGETVIVDVAQPHDVAPEVAELPDVMVRDLDALEAVTDATLADRQAAATAVEAIVADALETLLARYKRQRADSVIAAMYEGAERMKNAELRTARSQLEAAETPEDRLDVLESLADALVSQLLAAPTSSLREAAEHDDWETIHTALQLFDPSVEAVGDMSVAEGDVPPALAEHLSDGD